MSVTISENIINGVNLNNLGRTVQAIQEKPEKAKYRFNAETIWIDGAVSRTEIKRWKQAGTEGKTEAYTAHEIWIDEPSGLLGTDTSPNPVETILAGLSGCLAIGISYNAAARGLELQELKIALEGRLDLQGFLGLDREVRPGYDHIQLRISIKSPADQEKIADLVEYVKATSPVLDIIARPVPVGIDLLVQ